MRNLARFVYLGATAWWALVAFFLGGYGCDESCDVRNPSDWSDNPDAWQWDAIAWLGPVGLVVAFAAVAASGWRRWLGLTLLVVHMIVFAANSLVWFVGRTWYGSIVPFALAATFVAVCGFFAVGGRLPIAASRPAAL